MHSNFDNLVPNNPDRALQSGLFDLLQKLNLDPAPLTQEAAGEAWYAGIMRGTLGVGGVLAQSYPAGTKDSYTRGFCCVATLLEAALAQPGAPSLPDSIGAKQQLDIAKSIRHTQDAQENTAALEEAARVIQFASEQLYTAIQEGCHAMPDEADRQRFYAGAVQGGLTYGALNALDTFDHLADSAYN